MAVLGLHYCEGFSLVAGSRDYSSVTLRQLLIVKVKVRVTQSCLTPWTVAFRLLHLWKPPGKKYWSGLPFPSPGDLSDPGMEPGSPTLWADYLPSEPLGKLLLWPSTSSMACGLQ